MLERFTKRVSSKATEGAIESVKTTLNDRIDQYGDIIKIGLVLSVIIFGGKHLTKKSSRRISLYDDSPFYLPAGSGQPIVINNYYQRETKEAVSYHGNQKHYEPPKTGKNPQKR
jgi:hypothetical protein